VKEEAFKEIERMAALFGPQNTFVELQDAGHGRAAGAAAEACGAGSGAPVCHGGHQRRALPAS